MALIILIEKGNSDPVLFGDKVVIFHNGITWKFIIREKVILVTPFNDLNHIKIHKNFKQKMSTREKNLSY